MAIQVSSIEELKRVMMEETQRAMIKAEDNMLEDIGERINKEVYQAILSFMYRWQREKPFHRNYDVSKHIWNDRIHQTICVCWYENGECKSYVFGSYV
jgi:hypothetical protein